MYPVASNFYCIHNIKFTSPVNHYRILLLLIFFLFVEYCSINDSHDAKLWGIHHFAVVHCVKSMIRPMYNHRRLRLCSLSTPFPRKCAVGINRDLFCKCLAYLPFVACTQPSTHKSSSPYLEYYCITGLRSGSCFLFCHRLQFYTLHTCHPPAARKHSHKPHISGKHDVIHKRLRNRLNWKR